MPKGDAQQKARQRERNAASGTRAGSSGITKDVAAMQASLDWDEIEDAVEHVGDLMGKFQSGQIMANRTLTGTIVAPPEFGYAMLDISNASQGRALILRAYTVPLSAVRREQTDEA